MNKGVKVEEGVESGAENVLVCVEASAVLKAEFYISIVSVPRLVEFYLSESIKCQTRLKNIRHLSRFFDFLVHPNLKCNFGHCSKMTL